MGKFKDADLTIKTIKLFPDLKKKLRKGTISTIETPAKKFVDIRTRVKKAGGYKDGGSVRNYGTPSMMEMMTPKERAENKRKKMKESGLKPGDLEKKPGQGRKTVSRKAMGGAAGESLRKGTLFKEKRDRLRKEVDEMLDRVYGTGIKPKKKPKNPNRIKPKKKPKRPQESIMLRKLAKELRKRKANKPTGRSATAKRIANKGVKSKSKGINIRAGKGNPAGKDLSIAGQIKRLMKPGSRNVGEPGLRPKGTPKPSILGPDKGGKRVTPLKKKRGGSVKKKSVKKKK